MIYEDSVLKKKDLGPDTLFYNERLMMRDLSLFNFIPDENIDFMSNMIEFQRRKETLIAVNKIYEIKIDLYKSYGVIL
jgi:hypothetical protein